MSARIIVSIGVAVLLVVLIGALLFGNTPGFYLALAVFASVVVVALALYLRRRNGPHGGAFAGP